jgi:hypothetical protein
MKVRAEDLVETIRQVEFIKSSKILSEQQKQTFFKELINNLPLDIFCSTLKGMRLICEEVIQKEIKSDRPKPQEKSPAKKITPKAKKPKHVASG